MRHLHIKQTHQNILIFITSYTLMCFEQAEERKDIKYILIICIINNYVFYYIEHLNNNILNLFNT